MNKSFIIAAVVLVLFVAGGWYWYSSQEAEYSPAPVTSQTSPMEVVKVVVIYTNDGFSPSIITIKRGETVAFTNKSSDSMWVASAPHPAHNAYPTIGGCAASTFDSCIGIASEGSWAFTFDVAGTWGYHDHLNATKFGRVVVE